jgi:hypothetical protein
VDDALNQIGRDTHHRVYAVVGFPLGGAALELLSLLGYPCRNGLLLLHYWRALLGFRDYLGTVPHSDIHLGRVVKRQVRGHTAVLRRAIPVLLLSACTLLGILVPRSRWSERLPAAQLASIARIARVGCALARQHLPCLFRLLGLKMSLLLLNHPVIGLRLS